jgi:D-arabinose 1-dehydrogenase-like Zn-dependent alcohol dehydrogenase
MCAGVTTYNALRHSPAVAGDVVAILGVGGLGHLGVQFANKMGFHTVAIARGDDKEAFARELGANVYINSEKQDAAKELTKLGGAKVVLSTVTSSKAMTSLVEGLCIDGQLLVAGADIEPLGINPIQLIGGRKSVRGWASGTAMDSEDCMRFAAQTGVRALIERFPLDKAGEAYERMMSGKARFRVVIEPS